MYRFSNLPSHELDRLKALKELKIFDSQFETIFDSITGLISEICKTPIAIISFIDEDMQWFKSKVGVDGLQQIPRELEFGTETLQHDGVLEILDTTIDERFADNPLVIGEPYIRFYAGASISLPLGEKIGTLCVIDTKSNFLDKNQKIALEGLAKVISQILVVRNIQMRNKNLN